MRILQMVWPDKRMELELSHFEQAVVLDDVPDLILITFGHCYILYALKDIFLVAYEGVVSPAV